MTTILLGLVRCVLYPAVALLALVLLYAVSGLVQLMVSQYSSHLGDLKSPPVPSFFWGHLQMLHDAENTNLYIRWLEQLGTIFTYRGFIGVSARMPGALRSGLDPQSAILRPLQSPGISFGRNGSNRNNTYFISTTSIPEAKLCT